MRSTPPSRPITGSGLPDPLRNAFALEAESRRRGIPVAELAGERDERRRESASPERRFSRRALLGGATALAAGALVAPLTSRARASAATAPRIVIIGGGLAGLRCAHLLWNQARPLASTVYDADTTHIGGRCWSLRGFYDAGQVSEHGGSFISSTDTAALALAKSLGLKTEFANGGELTKGDYAGWINNAPYNGTRQQSDWTADAYTAFHNSYTAMGTPRYNAYTPAARQLDQMSCLDYLSSIGLSSGAPLTQLIESIQLQSGGGPDEASAVGMIGFLGASSTFDGGPGFDEKYHIAGGNDGLVTGMLAQLPSGTVRQGYELIALARNTDGSYACTFNNGGTTVCVQADHVVLALPFATLRNVDLTKAGLSSLKTTAIQQQGMGQNAKLVLQLTEKTWPSAGFNGVSNTGPSGYQTAWDGSVDLGANGSPALLVNFPGGDVARTTLTGAAHGPAPAADVTWFLDQIENVFPGTTAAYNGKAYEDHWSLDPWHQGAYHFYKVGQYTTFAGYEAVQEGNIHFAGEHTDVDNATLNAAVASGERAAAEINTQV